MTAGRCESVVGALPQSSLCSVAGAQALSHISAEAVDSPWIGQRRRIYGRPEHPKIESRFAHLYVRAHTSSRHIFHCSVRCNAHDHHLAAIERDFLEAEAA